MNKREVLYSKGGNNEFYTPGYAVEPLLKYIPKEYVVWCPFDEEDSQFVKVLRENGYKVIFSHIFEGQDFYEYEPEEPWDIIVSNPPFENKKFIVERAMSFGKPFALLFPVTWLNDSTPKLLYIANDLDMELILFDKRIKFTNPAGEINNKITFSSAYYCSKLLDKNIVIEILKNT